MLSVCKALFCQTRNLTVLVRYLSDVTNCQNVRVRFAPSPTGYLHLGGLRTALYNYLFAKANNGSFVLRIEDTDQTRLVEGAVENLENDLIWAGIIPDESPSRGGPYGPYVQSERFLLYKEHAELLIKSGAGYRCFCTPRRLDLLRKEAVRTRQVPRYDNRCRNYTEEEVQERLARGVSHCIRLKIEKYEGWDDMVLGHMNPDISMEGDPVLLKSDGFPTYHLACVVDDHHMEISHVLRGVEWQVSTPKHLLLYKALGWRPPRFAHLPLLLNADGTKLSKRQGGATVADQRAAGVFPHALLAWLSLAGGGFVRDRPGEAEGESGGSGSLVSDLERLPLEEASAMAARFDVGRVHSANCRLPVDFLPRVNQLELRRRLADPPSAHLLAADFARELRQRYGDRNGDSLQVEEEHVLEVLNWALPRISSLNDLLNPNLMFLWERPQLSIAPAEDELQALMTVRSVLASLPREAFEQEKLSSELRTTAKQVKMPFSKMMMLLRKVLSGLKEGPAVAEMLAILGPQVSLERLDAVITITGHGK